MSGQPDGRATSCSVMDLRHTQPSRVPAVRHWAAAELAALPSDALSDILLVVTELVSNAYDHGGGPDELRLNCWQSPWTVSVEVDDANLLALTIGRSRFTPGSYRGNGLVLVSRLAVAWGVIPHHDTGGKTVWARFALPDAA